MSETEPSLTELSDGELALVTGGTTPTPMPSFDIELTLSIYSQSTGAGAGKVTFNPFSITRK
jgi:hypothetical protein